jgi:hypothetical protein
MLVGMTDKIKQIQPWTHMARLTNFRRTAR